MTGPPLAAAAVAQLEAEGVDTIIGTVVNPAGLTQAKTVPIRRTGTFAEPGLGASPSWHAFAIDQTGIAFSDNVGVIGDQRVRIDLSALRLIGDGLAWGPAGFFEQDGTPVSSCSRGTLHRVEAALGAAGIEAAVGHEIEFVLVEPDGGRLPSALWAQYGLAGVLEHEAFVRDVIAAAATSGVGIEQLHPEYGANQFEISLSPLSPVAAADQLVLTRIIIGRAARRHGMRVSLSPAPFAGSVGSGAHQHFSLTTAQGPLFSGGPGAGGMTPAGESAAAGVIRGLPEAQGVLCGSIVSGLRIQPGNWAGAYACWGIENREAAVRFVSGGPGSTYGGNVEVKIVDPSANPYLASAAILGLAQEGIRCDAALPPETTVDPAQLSESDRERSGITSLARSQADIIAALDNSTLLRSILGESAVDMVVAVRCLEHEKYGCLSSGQLADRFRMAWSL
ncbi:type I glutamate--ammonia ligase [Mycobacterium montefiorense]|uniref:Glutamine synthetase GlnA n=1 Tax=Mycobacterium montefiorense TaxID=154654 RepID=A0AA37UVG6_9MYCO|nr:glutamine synthetase family protein [Mycobacterium montefiorense]GBG38967.1 glutamine synthetase GlnA [Mycobacterium montefiorense]GKU32755.1 glutamine synthetase GlnA [Mycobacterium montefiorense]GKU38277.1 glutamine synthetase GlnA [Mycobacterium montefiorense]GKU47423.1 glutamine synthetase GlnA [Mycobacterium montefiorense]GKU50306.1 glutamine synthetase GlnA [Mycobacterium montefiorense]